MKRISPTTRIAFGLACLTISILLCAKTLGFVPDERRSILLGRGKLCEAIAINFSLLAQRGDMPSMRVALETIASRNDDILSIGVRREAGEVLLEVGDHAAKWGADTTGRSTETHMSVPIASGGKPWGGVEIRFRDATSAGVRGLVKDPLIALTLFMGSVGIVAYYLYLRRMVQLLNPSNVVPSRVRAALDTLAEGLLVLDNNERIVLANRAFAKTAGRTPDQLQGCRISELPWSRKDGGDPGAKTPWKNVIDHGTAQVGCLLGLGDVGGKDKTFLVNSTPILGNDGKSRGVLASFDDVTSMEAKKAEMSAVLEKLKVSSDEIRRQNQELEYLATRDPLTGCLNRRSFLEKFDTLWKSASRYGHPLCCVMVDIDHFKLVNDNHGHQMGDQVLQKVAGVLLSTARDTDLVCRYGGEEFCVVMPHVALDQGHQGAERLRLAIETMPFSNLSITASLGISAIQLGAGDPQDLMEQADKSLYVAKRSGRNQVMRWDNVPEDTEIDESKVARTKPPADVDIDASIPFQAVTALISALAYRDHSTGEHSRRVADLCVAVAEGVMSLKECYVLETAALLHDIGKIGVPDAILLKPGQLTREEWQVMQTHDRIGVEIIRASFKSKELTEIVEMHHAFYGGGARDAGLPMGDAIPLGARVLTIADSYDAMISDRVYRKGRSPDEAFAELRRCAGTQFDPELVERFIAVMQVRNRTQLSSIPTVSKETALSIGLQIERLVTALDDHDLPVLQIMASRLHTMASREGVPEIAAKAAQLQASVSTDEDLIEVLRSANELLDLCRSTQKSYVCDPCYGAKR